MFQKFFRKKKYLLTAIFLSLIFCLGISIGYLSNHVFSENARFENFTKEIFENEISGSALTFHYSIANPEEAGISRPAASLGTIDTDMEQTYALCEKYENQLKDFSYSKLSQENQITLDMLLLYFHTRLTSEDSWLLEEVLSPSLGIQAQLPVLLAEYAFYEDQDITDYLNLLSSIGPYFDSILDYEKEKSAAGYFMSDATLDRICSQCSSFIQDPDSNYMQEIFSQKIADYGGLSQKDQDALNAAHKKILNEQVIPAYQRLITGLQSLRGTGTNDRGLAGFSEGQQYYLYLLKNEVGTWLSVEQIEHRLLNQLNEDCKTIRTMLQEQPSLVTQLTDDENLITLEPAQMLEYLQQQISNDFPALGDVSWEIRYVHKSLEDYLSPAFYLTPPVDMGEPNVIYINQASQDSSLNLFTTLAHEGFPGHLYQTSFFNQNSSSYIRSLLGSSGYVEGWATYVESYAYQYAASLLEDETARNVTTLAWLNRSVNLCLCSLLDVGIHYRGWTQQRAAAFLSVFGISEEASGELYQYILETPANYLKYYLGYLSFLDLRTSEEERLGDDFDLQEFHRKILEIGPIQFPILEKYVIIC
jgi:uncharacterized protein (DUF885 family)